MTQQEALALLEQLFEMPGPRRAKCATLYQLAQQVTGCGVIVELGTYHGCGAIALALGARRQNLHEVKCWDGFMTPRNDSVPVFTIDDYKPRKGWAGEPYGPADLEIRNKNIKAAGVDITQIFDTAQNAARNWRGNIELVFWDLGRTDCMLYDFWEWERHLVVGGKFAAHDTLGEPRLGAARLTADATACGRYRFDGVLPGGVWMLERVK